MPALILWDIDGTLMRGRGLIMQRFHAALRATYALRGELQRIDYGGKTDAQIVLETVALHGVSEDAALDRLPQFSAHYQHLIEAIASELHLHHDVLPGVRPLLDALQHDAAIQTVLTGNIAPVAALKLGAFGLDSCMDLRVGAYGSDHRDRNQLVPIAQRRATEHYGAISTTVVIGDTPRDIACGKAGYARTLAVATGHWTIGDLRAHAPDAVLPDFADTSAALATIRGLLAETSCIRRGLHTAAKGDSACLES